MSAVAYDYYEELGVPESANDADLKKAFRAGSLKWHPDRNQGDPGAEERFKRINEAYQVLSDPELRTRYDMERKMPNIGIDWETGQFDPSKINFTEESFIFAFAKMFGDYLDDKAPGVRSKVNDHVKKKKKSPAQREDKGSRRCSSKLCKTCKGDGRVRVKQGKVKMFVVCRACRGSGFEPSS